jgi:GWxTD domain-containing protein
MNTAPFWSKILVQTAFWTLSVAGIDALKAQDRLPVISVQAYDFKLPDNRRYVEFHFSCVAKTPVDATVLVFHADGRKDSLAYADRLLLVPPSSTGAAVPFVQKLSVGLDSGQKKVWFSFKSDGDTAAPLELKGSVRVDGTRTAQAFLAESIGDGTGKAFDRYGLQAIPLLSWGTPTLFENAEKLSVYAESYGWKKGDRGLVSLVLKDTQRQRDLPDFSTQRKFTHTLEGDVVVQPLVLLVAALPSGLYSAEVQFTKSDGTVHGSVSLPFYRMAPVDTTTRIQAGQVRNPLWWDRVADQGPSWWISSHYPIADAAQRTQIESLLLQKNDTLLLSWMEGFWEKRQPATALDAFAFYQERVIEVENEFATSALPGFATDRGRIYLQYGAPTLTEKRPFETDAYPYEMWQYNVLECANAPYQINRVFIFANLTVGTKAYELIHSTAIGEISNPRWQIVLQKRSYFTNDPDETGRTNRVNFGSRIGDNIFFGNGSGGR